MKDSKGDEPIQIRIHIYMEISKGNSFISKKQKYHVYFFFFFLFSSTKLENKRAE
jgi:hypothetical protein